MNHSLLLPDLHPDIPGRVEIIHGGENVSAFALALAQEKLLTERDLEGAEHLLPVVTAAIDRWTRRETAHLKFNVRLLFTDAWPSAFSTLNPDWRDSTEAEIGNLNQLPAAFALCLGSDCADYYQIGPRCTLLEERQPGLGASVVRLLERVCWNTIGGYGPHDALDDCCNWNWGGELDHKMRLEEVESEMEERAEYAPVELGQVTGDILLVFTWGAGPAHHGEMTLELKPKWNVQTLWLDCLDFSEALLTKDAFHEALPEWACHQTSRAALPSPARLRQASRRFLREPKLRQALLACADLAQLYRRSRLHSSATAFYTISETLSPLLLGWRSDGDMVARMYDDRANMVSQSGEGTEVRNIWCFALDDPAGCRHAIRQLRQVFRLLTALQTALRAVCDYIARV